jgi:hypothetical protein
MWAKQIVDNINLGELKNGTIVQAGLTETAIHLDAIGTLDAVAEIGEQLAWLGAAVRSSPEGWGLSYCTPFIRDLRIGLHGASQSTATCEIDFKVDRYCDGESISSNGRCWYALFRNSVIVKGFPIPARLKEDTGIEMPLNMMAGLAGTRRLQTFAGNIFLKSFSIILLLTKRLSDIVVWHLIFNDSGEHISYTDSRVWTSIDPLTQTTEIHSLKSARHVVGWCSKVSSLTGKFNQHTHVAFIPLY